MSYKDWRTSGLVYKQQDETIWIRQHGTLEPFHWLGRCAKLEEGTDSLGDLSVTQQRNPRGGIERHSIITGSPGESTTTLTMKRLQADRKKSDLKFCFWDVDQRIQCGGIDADAWNGWTEIIRYCYGKATERGVPGTAYDGDNEEQVVGFPWKSLYTDDLYRVTGESAIPLAETQAITAITTCQPDRCPDECENQADCVVVAVTESKTAKTPFISVNLAGGDLDEWETPVALAAWALATEDASDIACVGSFVVVVSQIAASIIYSDDRGTTQVEVTTADMTAHGPNCVDMIDQSFVVVGAEDGYIFGSYDAARTWHTLSAGTATTSAIDHIMIARDNPQVIYGISETGDVVVKSQNKGRTWYASTTGIGGPLTALYVVSQNHVLVGTDDGELLETVDGGAAGGTTSWTEQTTLPGLTTKADTNIEAIVGCGCGVLGLVVANTSTGDESFFYRNVDGGADGKWFQPDEYEEVANGSYLTTLACCGPNHFIAAGGDPDTSDLVLLLR